MKKNLVIIAGPTAVGKTRMAIEIAKHYQTEIISADSRQFFTELNIGTAKPSAEELALVPHHFINSHSIVEDYNVGRFETEALALLEKLFSEKEIIIMVGGSGMYIDVVCRGLDQLPAADEKIRDEIDLLYKNKGVEGLADWLEILDPEYHMLVDRSNPQRLSRAIEVCLSSGETYSALREGKKKIRPFKIIQIGLVMPRQELYDRIDERVLKMMEAGLLQEVKNLESYRNKNALQTVGYREIFDYIDGKTDLETAVRLIQQHSRNYAKRQLTWFKKNKAMKWFLPDEKLEILKFIEEQQKEI